MKNDKLESLFNLPAAGTYNDPEIEETIKEIEVSSDTLSTMEKVTQALPTIKGLETSDTELDYLAIKATEAFENLLDYGQQVDSRSAGEILGQASSFLGHAITARTAKMNKKLKMIDMQLKKARLEQTAVSTSDEVIQGTGTVLDRNELLKEILNQQKEQEKQ